MNGFDELRRPGTAKPRVSRESDTAPETDRPSESVRSCSKLPTPATRCACSSRARSLSARLFGALALVDVVHVQHDTTAPPGRRAGSSRTSRPIGRSRRDAAGAAPPRRTDRSLRARARSRNAVASAMSSGCTSSLRCTVDRLADDVVPRPADHPLELRCGIGHHPVVGDDRERVARVHREPTEVLTGTPECGLGALGLTVESKRPPRDEDEERGRRGHGATPGPGRR